MTHILTLNAGSSSLKFGVFLPETGGDPVPIATGMADRIGLDGGEIKVALASGGEVHIRKYARLATHDDALGHVLRSLSEAVPDARISAVGHRVVHGGPHFSSHQIATHEIIAELEALQSFAPLHQPHNLAGIRAATAAFPDALQVVCFDTAFHRGQQFEVEAFALPMGYYDKGVRRYGFHGLSYDYISGYLAQKFPETHGGRVAVAHLGNGASICGIHNGKSIASTMGFSALEGLPMGTRSGHLDPGVMLYLMQSEGMDAAQISDLLYKKSGLLGLSGVSSDMRTLEATDTDRARAAIGYFTFAICREIASLAAAMGGLDAVVFTGGIGENSARVRREVCNGLGWMGVQINGDANAQNAEVLSDKSSKIRVLRVETNEEIVIARAVQSAQ